MDLVLEIQDGIFIFVKMDLLEVYWDILLEIKILIKKKIWLDSKVSPLLNIKFIN
jgi:hypothetical protein